MRWAAASLVGGGVSFLVLAFALVAGLTVGQVMGPTDGNRLSAARDDAATQAGLSKVLDDRDFFEDVRSGALFERMKKSKQGTGSFFGQAYFGGPNAGSPSTGDPSATGQERRSRGTTTNMKTFRTVCVRLCDGYYYPVSTATTKGRFGKDDRACRSSCGTPARLYVYPTNGGSPDTMVDVKGRAYTDLRAAFQYRNTYDASCKCRAHPWEPDALKAHKLYASKAWQRKARRLARRNARKARRRGRIARRRSRRLQSGAYALGAGSVIGGASQVANVKRRRRARSAVRRKQQWTKRIFANPEN